MERGKLLLLNRLKRQYGASFGVDSIKRRENAALAGYFSVYEP